MIGYFPYIPDRQNKSGTQRFEIIKLRNWPLFRQWHICATSFLLAKRWNSWTTRNNFMGVRPRTAPVPIFWAPASRPWLPILPVYSLVAFRPELCVMAATILLERKWWTWETCLTLKKHKLQFLVCASTGTEILLQTEGRQSVLPGSLISNDKSSST